MIKIKKIYTLNNDSITRLYAFIKKFHIMIVSVTLIKCIKSIIHINLLFHLDMQLQFSHNEFEDHVQADYGQSRFHVSHHGLIYDYN